MLQQYRTKGFHHSFPPTRFQSAPTRAPAGASLTSTPRPKDWAFPQQLWGKHSSNKAQGLTHSPCRGVSATDTMPSSPGAAPGGPKSTSARCSGCFNPHASQSRSAMPVCQWQTTVLFPYSTPNHWATGTGRMHSTSEIPISTVPKYPRALLI